MSYYSPEGDYTDGFWIVFLLIMLYLVFSS